METTTPPPRTRSSGAPLLKVWATMKIVNAVMPIPRKVAMRVLMLCLTTSASFSAFIFGYLRLSAMPINSASNGKTIDARRIKMISRRLKSNFANMIRSPMRINGSITKTAANTLLMMMVVGFTGMLFRMLKARPSREIIELVMEDMTDAMTIRQNRMAGANCLTISARLKSSSTS